MKESSINSRSLYFNFYSGVSGDMLIASLIDLGVDPIVLKKILFKIDKKITFEIKKVKRGVNQCTLIKPIFPNGLNKNLNWSEIKDFGKLIKSENYVFKNFIETVELLETSEKEVHNDSNTEPHELGNFDTVFDIVCFYKCIEYLNVENLYYSGIPLNQGEIHIDHGSVSSVAPVSLNLIKKMRVNIYNSKKNPNFEMSTPTGITLLKNFNHSGSISGFIKKIGYGAGTKDFKDSSNSISVSSIESNNYEKLKVIETNVDDMSPEYIPFIIEKILELGVKDVWAQNIIMKKGRPAIKISVLSSNELISEVVDILKKETSTFGVRISTVERQAFDRKIEQVSTKYGEIKLKIKFDSGNIIGAYPEYEDCKNLSKVHNIPLKVIFDEALAQFNKLPR